MASLVAQLVKNPPAMWETWVPSPGWEEPLEKGLATHSGVLAWRIPRPVSSMGLQSIGHDCTTFPLHFSLRINRIRLVHLPWESIMCSCVCHNYFLYSVYDYVL